jgi:hypothetical protein
MDIVFKIVGFVAFFFGLGYLIVWLTKPKGHYARIVKLTPKKSAPKPQPPPPSRPKPPSGPNRDPDIHDREPRRPIKPTLADAAENETEEEPEPEATPVRGKVTDPDK